MLKIFKEKQKAKERLIAVGSYFDNTFEKKPILRKMAFC